MSHYSYPHFSFASHCILYFSALTLPICQLAQRSFSTDFVMYASHRYEIMSKLKLTNCVILAASLHCSNYEQRRSRRRARQYHGTSSQQSRRIPGAILQIPVEAFIAASATGWRSYSLHDNIWWGSCFWRLHLPLGKHRTRCTNSVSLPSTFLDVSDDDPKTKDKIATHA